MQRVNDKGKDESEENELIARSTRKKRFSFAGSSSAPLVKNSSTKRSNVLRKKHDRSENFTGSQQDLAIIAASEATVNAFQAVSTSGSDGKPTTVSKQRDGTTKVDRFSTSKQAAVANESRQKGSGENGGAYALRTSHSQPNLALLDRKLSRSASSKARKAAERGVNGNNRVEQVAADGTSNGSFDSNSGATAQSKTKVVANALARSNTNTNLAVGVNNSHIGAPQWNPMRPVTQGSQPMAMRGGLQRTPTSTSGFPNAQIGVPRSNFNVNANANANVNMNGAYQHNLGARFDQTRRVNSPNAVQFAGAQPRPNVSPNQRSNGQFWIEPSPTQMQFDAANSNAFAYPPAANWNAKRAANPSSFPAQLNQTFPDPANTNASFSQFAPRTTMQAPYSPADINTASQNQRFNFSTGEAGGFGNHSPKRTNTVPSGRLQQSVESTTLHNSYTAQLRRQSLRLVSSSSSQLDAAALKQRFIATLSEARMRDSAERTTATEADNGVKVEPPPSPSPAALHLGAPRPRSMSIHSFSDENTEPSSGPASAGICVMDARSPRRKMFELGPETLNEADDDVEDTISPAQLASVSTARRPSLPGNFTVGFGAAHPISIPFELPPAGANGRPNNSEKPQLNPIFDTHIMLAPAPKSRNNNPSMFSKPPSVSASAATSQLNPGVGSSEILPHFADNDDDQFAVGRLVVHREPPPQMMQPLLTMSPPPLPPKPMRNSSSPIAISSPNWMQSPPVSGFRTSNEDPFVLPPRRSKPLYKETNIDAAGANGTGVAPASPPAAVLTAKMVTVSEVPAPQPQVVQLPVIITPVAPVPALPSVPVVANESFIDSVTQSNTVANAGSNRNGPALLASLAALSGRQRSAEESEYDRAANDFASATTGMPDAYWRSLLTAIAPNFKRRTNHFDERDEEYYEDSEIDSGVVDESVAPNKSASDYLDEVFRDSSQPPPIGVALEPFTDHQRSLFNRYNSIRRKLHKATSSSDETSERQSDAESRNDVLLAAGGQPHSTNFDPERWRGDVTNRLSKMTELANKKMEHLRLSATDVELDMQANDELGRQIRALLLRKCTVRSDIDKYDAHVNELDKIIKLLLQLSVRLARTEELIRETTESVQKKMLVDKRNRLRIQYDDAKQLKVAMDKRSVAVHQTLTELFTAEEFDEYRLYVEMKAKLVIEHQELQDCLHTAEAQLTALRNAQTALSAFTSSQITALQSSTYQHSG